MLPVLAEFEKPGTQDFVWPTMFKIFGFPVNWIIVMALVTLAVVTAFFYLGLRKAKPARKNAPLTSTTSTDHGRPSTLVSPTSMTGQ